MKRTTYLLGWFVIAALLFSCLGKKNANQATEEPLVVMDEMVTKMAKDWHSWNLNDWENFFITFMEVADVFLESNPSKNDFYIYRGIRENMRLTIGVVHAISEKTKTEDAKKHSEMIRQALENTTKHPSYEKLGKKLAAKENELLDKYASEDLK